ncbi:hypothetical protein BDN72DRAFT_879088 [Pluteus cervinus]|uniref:Uncharacterized protein n=1 Tax=Pluteus cervinus TaxID=181527 RepID=A0ACD3ASS8_9AGAR|nr:hypothetical protein BDN72DRAFT_879088 [Pluteus cervinus]
MPATTSDLFTGLKLLTVTDVEEEPVEYVACTTFVKEGQIQRLIRNNFDEAKDFPSTIEVPMNEEVSEVNSPDDTPIPPITRIQPRSRPRPSSKKQYPCPDCPAAFSRSADLTRHQKTSKMHNLAQEFTCSECGNLFYRIDSVKRHAKKCGKSNEVREEEMATKNRRGSRYPSYTTKLPPRRLTRREGDDREHPSRTPFLQKIVSHALSYLADYDSDSEMR